MSDGEPIDPNQARHGHALAKGEKLRRDTIEVGELLGQGGFGMVYQAHTEGLISTQMVIKEYLPRGYARRDHNTKSVLPISTSGDEKEAFDWGLEMFLKEAKVLRKFEHKNIVRMDDYFEENNTAYMRLEYIKGETLADKLKREGRLKEQALKDILAGVLDGLAYVHEREHLHRDISPDNIMIREDGTPVLIDFGIARAKFGTAVHGSRMGVKPGYSPIEQRGQAGGIDMKMEYGPGTDIYALSVVVYQALGGELPMDWIPRSARLGSGPDPMVPAVEALRGLAHENFLKAIDRGLQINLKDRPKSVADFRKMLFAEGVQNQIDRSPTRFDRGRGGFQKPEKKSLLRRFGMSKAAIIGLVIALIALPALGYVVSQISLLEAFLSENGFASINAPDKDGLTPLHIALLKGNDKVAALLIQKGADVKAPDKEGKTPLHYARSAEIAALLIEAGADVKAPDKDGYTPLHEAAARGKNKVAALLIQNGADVKAPGKDGYTPLHEAAARGKNKVAALLIQNGADVKAPGKDGWTPLHFAAAEDKDKVAALLIQNGAKVDARNEDDWTPLHVAAAEDKDKVAALLIQNGAKVDARNEDDWTPLHVAARFGRDKVAALLIKANASVDVRALAHAIAWGHSTTEALLEEARGKK